MGLAQSTQGISSSSLSNERASGILGLGFSGLMQDPNHDVPFITNLVKNKVIEEPVFSIYLNKQGDYGYTGEIVIGGYETTRFTGQLSFLPVINYDGSSGKPNLGQAYSSSSSVGNYKYWTVPGQAIVTYQADGTKLYETQFNDLQPAILDTGTTLSYLPNDVVLALLASITSNYQPLQLNSGTIQAYQVNCSDFTQQRKKLWFDFEFSALANSFSNNPVIIRVPLDELVLPQDTNNISTSTHCLFGLAPISSGFLNSIGSGWIIGQTVLRSAYVVYDMLGLQVGIGAVANGYYSPTFDDGQMSNASSRDRSFVLFISMIGCSFLLFILL